MNKYTLNFQDKLLEREFFWWSFNRDFFVLKIFLGSLVLVVQFPSIIISIYRTDNQIALGWGFLMLVSIVAFCCIKYKPQSYNFLLSLYHLLIMIINVYYLFMFNNNMSEKYGDNILFVYAAAHGTSHSTIVMLGSNFLMNSLSMMIAYSVYAITFLDKGFNTFHLFLLFIAAFTLVGKYIRDRSQREMFLMRERENKWLNIMKKALPSSIVLVQYNEKLDKINLDLVNQNAKNLFKFQNDQSFSEFSRKMQLEKQVNLDMTLSNSQTDKFINFEQANNQSGAMSSLSQFINAKFREIAREKKQPSSGKGSSVIQNMKQLKKLNNSDAQEKIEQSNSLSNESKQVIQNSNINCSNQFNFFPGDQKEQNIQNPHKSSITLKKGKEILNMSDVQAAIRQKSLSNKKKKIGSNTLQNTESISIETFIGVYRSNDDQQLKRYNVKVIHYNVGQYYCLIVIEEQSDEEKIQFLKKQNKSSEQIVQNFIDNIGKHISRMLEQLKDQQLKELIYKKSPKFLRTLKYESSIVYNSIYNIRSHFLWAKQKVKVKYDKISIQSILDDIYDTFQGNAKAIDNRVKLFISRRTLSIDNQLKTKYIYSDIVLIKQLLYNLLQNSFDYTEKGYIVLRITEIPGENELSTIIKFEVSDSGSGFQTYIDKVNNLLNVQNPQFSDHYYGSICFGLKNSQKIVKTLGPYSKLFMFTRNNQGSRICFYLYQNMSLFQQNNNRIQFQNILFEEDLKSLKEHYKNEQKLINEKENLQETSSFLGFENVTQINIKELEENTDQTINETKFCLVQPQYKNSVGEFSKTLYSNQFSSTTYQTKNNIFSSPNKRLFSQYSGNLYINENEDLLPFNQFGQSKTSQNTIFSTSNTQIARKSSKDFEDRQRNLSLQEEQSVNKERTTSIFKKNNSHEQNCNQISQSNVHQQMQVQGNASPKISNLDYSVFIDRIQEEQKMSSLQLINKMSTLSISDKKSFNLSPVLNPIKYNSNM